MSTMLPSELLEVEHRQIDAGIEGILDQTGQLSDLAQSLALLRVHLYVEEEILFPPLEEIGITMPIFVMKSEHGEMWPLLETLTLACEHNRPIESIQDPCLHLFQLLQVHNPKEEEVVYTAADKLAAEQADNALVTAMQAAELPEGWVCAAAPQS